MKIQETYKLSNGVEIPVLGLGTWMISDQNVAGAVIDAVALGYRHIDTAQAYQNERGVGEGIKKCGVEREKLFITTKLAAEIKTYEGAVRAITDSLNIMQLDYLDLVLIHSPWPWANWGDEDRYFKGNQEAWWGLEDLYKIGKIKAMGVSNFQKVDLDNLIKKSTIKPMVNQLLAHVTNMPEELIKYSQEQGMLVEAYSPMGHGELYKNEKLLEIAKDYSVSLSQLCIQYTLQRGLLPLPKTGNPDHMKENGSLNFTINDEDMIKLNLLEEIKDYGDASIFPVYKK